MIIVIIAIFYLTLQSPGDTIRVSTGLQDAFKVMLPNSSGRWTVDMHWFRTLLHLPLYFILGGVVYYAFSQFWLSVVICASVAIADEVLKIFLPTREFGTVDIIFDSVGFLIGIATVYFIQMLFKK